MSRSRLRAVLGLILGGVFALRGVPVPGADHPLLVFAAASLSDVLEQVDAAYTRGSGVDVRASYAASSLLAKQIEAGAGADVFISADEEWMDYLQQRSDVRAATRRDLLGNALVLIAPRNSPVHLAIQPGVALSAALGDGRLAMADPDTVPAGRYGAAALRSLGLWDGVSARIARAENVRAALAYVARGETPLGVVYRTDAQSEPRVSVVGVFPGYTHPPIHYPVALTARAGPTAGRYLDFLRSATARAFFRRAGFEILP
ncbi:MAG: molybdate ABC transporter substrate-binding protein [Gammaproteobacteria bacterium]|nr:molybdate ABC transporter substrate-binding protein [Gammaproteobacteria bacterium]